MRDYSFGNYISAQRERCGLSQYQLGALVGVSDKAVSKWENGVSKPRIDTMRKLAEVLDVSADELLTCEYDTFNDQRKDLFAMKKEILMTAEKRLKELYGDVPPIRIVSRFKTEALMLEGQEMLLWMGFMGKLREVFCKENACFEIRDVQMGASFIAWLLGGTNVNPLPAHYYCPNCKCVEFMPEERCGADLPDKICSCGKPYHKDGFDIDAIHMYPLKKYSEIELSDNKVDLVKSCLREYFQGYGVIRELTIVYNCVSDDQAPEQCTEKEFVLLPEEVSKRFPEEGMTIPFEEYCRKRGDLPTLTVIKNTEKQFYNFDLRNAEFTEAQMKAFLHYAAECGNLGSCNENLGLQKLLSDIPDPRFSDLLSVYGFLRSSGAWTDNAELLYEKGIPLCNLIFCREDVYTYLYGKLNGRCCDDPSGLVYEIKEMLRKGKYSRNRMPKETEQLLLESEVPEWYVESMKKILYLAPKTLLIVQLKLEICRFLQRVK